MVRFLTIALALLGLTGCAETRECQKEQFYEVAAPGKRVETPEGLDPLPQQAELQVPQASPQAPPPPGACVDMPPTLRTSSGDD